MKKTGLFILIIIFFDLSLLLSGNIKGIVKTREGGLINTLVYIEKIEGKIFPPPDKPAIMDQVNLMFVPHIQPVLLGTTVTFPNSDSTRHNVFSPSKIKKFDLGTYPYGSKKSIICDKPGAVSVLCHVHPEMSAFIIILETPYFALSNEKGFYLIQNVPPGKYRLSTWHEWASSKTQVIEVLKHGDTVVNFLLTE